jgi:hypothetical protein
MSNMHEIDRWGDWFFESGTLMLKNDNGHCFDLGLIRDSATMLDWLFQAHRYQCSPDSMSWLMAAVRDILDPQSNYCPPKSRPDPRALLRQSAERLIEEQAKRTGGSRCDVVDQLIPDCPPGITIREINTAISERGGRLTVARIGAFVIKRVNDGEYIRTGTGTNYDPHRYYRLMASTMIGEE